MKRHSAAAKAILLRAGHYRRRLAGARFPGVVVLCYHAVRPDASRTVHYPFEQLHVSVNELAGHCAVVARSCTPISLDDLRQAVVHGAPLPARPVLVTFDDGYRSVATLAAPILERHSIPAAFFVCSGSVADRRLLWYDAMARRGAEADVDRVKRATFEEWQRVADESLTRVDDDDPLAPMTIDDLRSLAANPLFEIGAHTMSHPILANAGVAEQRDQIVGSVRALESWTGRRVTSFAYPNGQPGIDYTPDTVALAQEAGVDIAFSTRSGFAGRAAAALEQPRFMMLSGVSQSELAHRFAYSWRRVADAQTSAATGRDA
jgi:peptidoglycan/xylan/chitin deacetylase (PgdA/CDA1 family)